MSLPASGVWWPLREARPTVGGVHVLGVEASAAWSYAYLAAVDQHPPLLARLVCTSTLRATVDARGTYPRLHAACRRTVCCDTQWRALLTALHTSACAGCSSRPPWPARELPKRAITAQRPRSPPPRHCVMDNAGGKPHGRLVVPHGRAPVPLVGAEDADDCAQRWGSVLMVRSTHPRLVSVLMNMVRTRCGHRMHNARRTGRDSPLRSQIRTPVHDPSATESQNGWPLRHRNHAGCEDLAKERASYE